jgi:hypothetical protein
MNNLIVFTILIIGPILAYFLYKFYKFYINGVIKNNGLLYSWESNKLASAANPPPQNFISGHRWNTVDEFKAKSLKNKKSKNPVFSSTFSTFKDHEKELELPNRIKNKIKKEKFYLNANNICRSMLILGGAGGGKTVYFLNLLSQRNWYSKAVILSKKGDFDKVLFRGKTIDILVQNKLKEASIHNILDEKIQFIEVFVKSIMNASLGEKQDYFSSSAKMTMEEILQEIFIKASDDGLTIKEKWAFLLSEYERKYEETMKSDNKSLKDVLQTVKLQFQIFYFMAWRIIETDAATFTAKDFFNSKHDNRIFLNATDPTQEGSIAATYSVLVKYQLSLPKDWCTLPVVHIQDEYNSFSRIVGEALLNEVREVGRSFMFAPIAGIQGLPSNKEKAQQLLTNMQYLVAFAGTDTETLNAICNTVGKVEYINHKENVSTSRSGKSVSISEEHVKKDVLTNYHLNILQDEEFSHIFIGIKEKILFKGQNPLIEMKERNIDTTAEVDMVDYYRWLKMRKETLKNQSAMGENLVNEIISETKW